MLKILAEMPARRYIMRVLAGPKVYSTRETNKKVTRMLPKMCKKLTCKNIADNNLYTSPFFKPGW